METTYTLTFNSYQEYLTWLKKELKIEVEKELQKEMIKTANKIISIAEALDNYSIECFAHSDSQNFREFISS